MENKNLTRENVKMLIDLDSYSIQKTLSILLQDKTTKSNICFATNSYSDKGNGYAAESPITKDILLGLEACEIQPRVAKAQEEQAARTRSKAEVFTPSWICNLMNNHCDEEWFGCKDVFNYKVGENHEWQATSGVIEFPADKTWKEYVDSRRLEITCGEAPYIASRYDTTTGEIIPIEQRIGILDRKLRVVDENTATNEEWMKWAARAFQSVYGYEYQGDNLLIARINLLNTYIDYHTKVIGEAPDDARLRYIANIIAWNFWQMDGLKGTVPFSKQEKKYEQISLFDFFETEENATQKEAETEEIPCIIRDWRSNCSVEFNSMRKGN